MIAIRIARRLARKFVKPVALWLNARAARASEIEAIRLLEVRTDAGVLFMYERRHQVELMVRRRQIEGW